jgi:hypothetical protein
MATELEQDLLIKMNHLCPIIQMVRRQRKEINCFLNYPEFVKREKYKFYRTFFGGGVVYGVLMSMNTS